jgi:hypothetical protein
MTNAKRTTLSTLIVVGIILAVWLLTAARRTPSRSHDWPRIADLRPPRLSPAFGFVIAGDTGTGGRRVMNLVRQMCVIQEKEPLSGVFLVGDNLMGDAPFESAVQDRFLAPFNPLLKENVPFFAALGNHDCRPGISEKELTFPLFNMNGRNYYQKSF